MLMMLQANAAHLPLADESVHCCITSPPYWGLRDYGLPPSVWGGDAGCAHEWGPNLSGKHQSTPTAMAGRFGDGNGQGRIEKPSERITIEGNAGAFCSRCDAWRGCLGLEPTVDLYVEHLVAVMREVRRVLRKDGTLWLNLGSSYASSTSNQSLSRSGMHVPACDSDGTAPQDSPGADPASCDCDGEHPTETPTHRDHIARSDRCEQPDGQPTWPKDHDSERLDCDQAFLGASLPDAQASTIRSSSVNDQDVCGLASEASGGRCVPLTSDDGDLRCVHRDASLGSLGTSEKSRSSVGRTADKAPFVAACGDPSCKGDCGICWAHYTIPLLKFKAKDLVSVPWLVALALQADGWYLRSDIIWCLSGGTTVYAKTQKGEMPMTVKDMARLDPSTVRLWNGDRWTQLLGTSKSARSGDEIELVLRSGERIACTPTHRFPTQRGLLAASDIKVGDVLESCRLPEPETVRDCAIDEDAAWFAGLYIAEGSRSGDTIQIAGHSREMKRWTRIQTIASKYGGTTTRTVIGNNMSIRVYGKMLNTLIDELVTGHTAKDKGFAPHVWQYSNAFIAAMVDGYLAGDGHKDGSRWRIGFCRNYTLERDLRTACARLGYRLTLNLAAEDYDGRRMPTFRGEIRKESSGHHNEKDRGEVMEIRKARCRNVYNLGVADASHLFALASGILTHNSKPNPMPESVTDRPTKAHEYVFLLSKSKTYYYDAEAIREPISPNNTGRISVTPHGKHVLEMGHRKQEGRCYDEIKGANRRSVWTVATQPYSGSHFATFPPDLVEPMILAGTSERGCCPECGTPWERVVQRATCDCPAHEAVPCVVLDPFCGSGTTGMVAVKHRRRAVLIDLSRPYLAELAVERVDATQMRLEAP